MEDKSHTLLSFRVGKREFAVRESEIATVASWRQPTPLPHAPPAVMGVVSLQGRMLTVLDFEKLTDSESAANGTRQHIIALRGDEHLALAVDDIAGKLETSEGAVEVKPDGSGITLGVLDLQGQHIEIVNVKALFSSAIQGRERRQRRF